MNNIKTSEYSSLSDEIQKREEEIREYQQAIEEHSQKEVEARQRITVYNQNGVVDGNRN